MKRWLLTEILICSVALAGGMTASAEDITWEYSEENLEKTYQGRWAESSAGFQFYLPTEGWDEYDPQSELTEETETEYPEAAGAETEAETASGEGAQADTESQAGTEAETEAEITVIFLTSASSLAVSRMVVPAVNRMVSCSRTMAAAALPIARFSRTACPSLACCGRFPMYGLIITARPWLR